MNLDIVLNSRHHFSDKGPYSKGCGLSSCHAWLWEMDCKEGTVLKHLCFQTVVLEKSHEISLDSKESKPVNLKGNQLWILIRRTDVESEVPILWSPDVKRLVIGNDPDAGKDWRQKKGMTENDDWMRSPMQRTWMWANSVIWWWMGRPAAYGVAKSQAKLGDWTTTAPTPSLFEISDQALYTSSLWTSLWNYD